MNRKELDFVLAQNHYLEGGTKEACIKVRNFLHHATTSRGGVQSAFSCISNEEFIEAVKTLMAFAFPQEDTIPEKWKCDSDCRMVASFLCPGECNISETANKMCPFFTDEGLI